MPKSPINIRSPQKFAVGSTIRTADGKTIIIGSPQKQQQQQIIIRPSTVGGIQQQLQTKENITQQIIRSPASSKSESGLQQISAGSKVQYVRVISTQAVRSFFFPGIFNFDEKYLCNNKQVTNRVSTQSFFP